MRKHRYWHYGPLTALLQCNTKSRHKNTGVNKRTYCSSEYLIY